MAAGTFVIRVHKGPNQYHDLPKTYSTLELAIANGNADGCAYKADHPEYVNWSVKEGIYTRHDGGALSCSPPPE